MSVAVINKRVIHRWHINIKNAKPIVLKFKEVMIPWNALLISINYWVDSLVQLQFKDGLRIPRGAVVPPRNVLCQLAKQQYCVSWEQRYLCQAGEKAGGSGLCMLASSQGTWGAKHEKKKDSLVMVIPT